VLNAGGLGTLPCALLSTDAMRKVLAALRSQTTKLYDVNFFCDMPPAAHTALLLMLASVDCSPLSFQTTWRS
jgi:hypothetical protein